MANKQIKEIIFSPLILFFFKHSLKETSFLLFLIICKFILPDGTRIDATSGANDTWWAMYTFDDYGVYQVNATYIGLDNVTVNNGTINITKADSVIILDDIVLNYGESVNVTVVTEGAVGITANIDGDNVTVVNDYTIPISGLSVGNYTLTVTTIPDGDHNPVTKAVNLTVNKATTVIDAVYNNESGMLVATLTSDITGQPIKGAYVVIKLAGETYKVKTNSSGQAVLPVEDIAPKSYVATVSYKGSDKYVSSNTTVDVALMGYANITAVYDADTNEITVTLVDTVFDKALKGAYVYVKVGNTKFKVKIDATGQGKVSLDNATPGNYTVSVTYNGGTRYYAVNTTVDVAFMGYANISAVYDDSTGELTVTLVNNASGKAISGAYVYVKVDGKTSKVKIDATGQGKLSLADLAPGTYEAILTYKGSANKYYPANTTAEIVVKK